jgi:anaerobic selenocysteine-containing dehydrogenase
MPQELKHTVCRICHAHCDLVVDVREGKVHSIHGNKDNPVYKGYSCIKGREMGTLHSLPTRLLTSMKRQPDGSHAPIASAAAATEIGDKIKAIIAEHGPRSVALFVGTYGYINFAAHGFGLSFMRSIKSPMVFTSVTIDQPGKGIALGLHGPWLAGTPAMEDWDALLLVGSNPIVSMNGGLGVNPARRLKVAQKRGMKLIVIDPRESESAKKADLFLQCRPGEDPTILAGIARAMIVEGLFDSDFVAAETSGLDALKAAVEPFTPEYVAGRAGVRAEDIITAARIMGAAKRGAVSAGTGPNMSGHCNITEYLVKTLTTLRGWWLQAGEMKANPGVLVEPFPAIAASPGPFPAYDFGEKLRVRGFTDTAAGLPTAALADEILTPGAGQVKALIVLGGNPMLAWPDQIKTLEAMKALDLLVCFDPHMSATCELAHYVIAPKLALEVEGNTAATELFGVFGPGWGYEEPYAHISPPVLPVPPGSDLTEEWEVIYAVAQRMGLSLSVRPFVILDPAKAQEMATEVDMKKKPSTDDVWRITLKGSPVPYDTVREAPQGRTFDVQKMVVREKPAGWTGRLDIGSGPMMAELAEVAAETPANIEGEGAFPFRLISRRLHDMHNSNWHESPRQKRKWAYNPAFMNPADLAALGVDTGDVIEIESARATILGVAEAAPDVRAGCVSMSHSFGRNPGQPENPHTDGGNTGRLSFNDRDFDAITGIPRMSTIPVRVMRRASIPAE